MKSPERPLSKGAFRVSCAICLYVFLGIAAFFLLSEHRAHLLGALPWLLLLLCPLIHLFMHRGHRHGHGHGRSPGPKGSEDDAGEER